MANIRQAKEILNALGMPLSQQNENACWTLLALASLAPTDSWDKATASCIRIHDMITFLSVSHDKKYAENSRETIRRQALHQFVQGGLAVLNPDSPLRPTNSPNSCYCLTPEALEVLHAFGTPEYPKSCDEFIAAKGRLATRYGGRGRKKGIPVTLPGGKTLALSPGAHNELQAAVVRDFGSYYVPGAQVLYLGDTANKMLLVEEEVLQKLKVPMTKHDKLPDVLFHLQSEGLLVLVEVVTSHGPLSPKRLLELEDVMAECTLQRIYVTAFPDFKEFRKHLEEIAWGTEVWLADCPDHVIHYNGPSLYLRET